MTSARPARTKPLKPQGRANSKPQKRPHSQCTLKKKKRNKTNSHKVKPTFNLVHSKPTGWLNLLFTPKQTGLPLPLSLLLPPPPPALAPKHAGTHADSDRSAPRAQASSSPQNFWSIRPFRLRVIGSSGLVVRYVAYCTETPLKEMEKMRSKKISNKYISAFLSRLLTRKI